MWYGSSGGASGATVICQAVVDLRIVYWVGTTPLQPELDKNMLKLQCVQLQLRSEAPP